MNDKVQRGGATNSHLKMFSVSGRKKEPNKGYCGKGEWNRKHDNMFSSSQIDRCVHRYCRSTSYFWFDELMPQRLNSSEQTIAAKLYNGQDQLRWDAKVQLVYHT